MMEVVKTSMLLFSLGFCTVLFLGIFLVLNKIYIELAKITMQKELENKYREIEVDFFLKLDKINLKEGVNK